MNRRPATNAPSRLRRRSRQALTSALALSSLGAAACGVHADPDAGPAAPIRETVSCTVTRVVDGDTLVCEPVGRIRLLGIDTPELAQEPFGAMAGEALEELIPADGRVRVERDAQDRDPYDRALRYVWVNGSMVNWHMVRRGYAVLLTYPPNVQWADALEAAQTAAREEGLGLWGAGGFACEPRDFRGGRCP